VLAAPDRLHHISDRIWTVSAASSPTSKAVAANLSAVGLVVGVVVGNQRGDPGPARPDSDRGWAAGETTRTAGRPGNRGAAVVALVAWDLSRQYWSTRCWPADVRVGMARTNRATACCATAVGYITVLLESWHGNDRVVSGPVGAAQ